MSVDNNRAIQEPETKNMLYLLNCKKYFTVIKFPHYKKMISFSKKYFGTLLEPKESCKLRSLRKRLVSFSILCIFLLLNSCELAKIGDPEVLTDVEDEFFVDMRESLGADFKQFTLDVFTIDDETCKNTAIDFSIVPFSSGYKITLNDIITPQDCDPGLEPAEISIPVQEFRNGSYAFEINLKDVVKNNGLLQVNESFYRLTMNSSHGLTFLNSTLFKIPEKIIWGYLAYNENNTMAASETSSFINKMETLGEAADLDSGYYGYFRITSPPFKALVIKQQPENLEVEPFIYKFTGDKSEIEQEANKLKKAFGSQIKIAIFDDTGWEYQS